MIDDAGHPLGVVTKTDVLVHERQRKPGLEPDDTPVFKCHGGGGTDFAPPFKKLEEEDIVPKCLVYLTDLHGPHGPEPGYPVLWVSVTENKVAPWGETLYIKPYGEEQ